MTIRFDENGLRQIILLSVKITREFPQGTPEEISRGIVRGLKKAPLSISEDGVHVKLG